MNDDLLDAPGEAHAGAASLTDDAAKALVLMEQALELLDTLEGLEGVGAHLDLAICRLRDAISAHAGGPRAHQNAEPVARLVVPL